MPGIDKLIVTNLAALRSKYGSAGLGRIQNALNQLIAADRTRSLTTAVLAIDDPAAMASVGGTAVTRPDDYPANKAAIDAAYNHLQPDYLMILGATDIVGHQDIRNPLYSGPNGDDPDEFAWGDLPYACDAPYSQDINTFKGPTRVVGRLPDHTGASDPQLLEQLIGAAANAASQPIAQYQDHFAATAALWEASTRSTVRAIFGSDKGLKVVPPDGPPWPPALLAARIHFFNCHGAESDPHFYGQPVGAYQYPVALSASDLPGNITRGTIVAAECCYGGELYATTALQPGPPICNTYLDNGAVAIWASTTIAYGPSSGNGQADLITRYFLVSVRNGASIGRGALEARQNFVRSASPAGPGDLKTLAQYNLYGDPSVTPVSTPSASLLADSSAPAAKSARLDRRSLLARQGDFLRTSEPHLIAVDQPVTPAVIDRMRELAGEAEMHGIRSFELAPPISTFSAHLFRKQGPVSNGFVTAFVTPAEVHEKAPFRPVRLVVARVADGQVIDVAILESRSGAGRVNSGRRTGP